MGYLNKATITVDAILTNRGRELLAQGTGQNSAFNITKFAIADDEVDYRLYRTDHPNGSARYGAIIENMPMLEATPDETQTMRYKLVTYTGTATGQVIIPQITGLSYASGLTLYNAPGSGTNSGQSKSQRLIPKTTFTATDNSGAESSYTVVVSDGSLVSVKKEVPSPSANIQPDARGSITAVGQEFTITADKSKTGSTTITVYGNQTGATYSFLLTVA